AVRAALEAAGAVVEIIAPRQGFLLSANDVEIAVDHSLLTAASALYDAVYVPGGADSSATIGGEPDGIHFFNQAFMRCKAIAVDAGARQVVDATYYADIIPAANSRGCQASEGNIVEADRVRLGKQFNAGVAKLRFREREKTR